MAEALRDVNALILQAVTAEQREIFSSSALDDYLLDAERDARRRRRRSPPGTSRRWSRSCPGAATASMLSASDIDTYLTCPLKYKFARVFRIPQEPTIHQRFGILVHQVLERFHARTATDGTLPELLGPARGRLAALRVRRLRGRAPVPRARRRGADPLPRAL